MQRLEPVNPFEPFGIVPADLGVTPEFIQARFEEVWAEAVKTSRIMWELALVLGWKPAPRRAVLHNGRKPTARRRRR